MLPKLIHLFLVTLFNFHYLSLQVEVAAAKCHPDDEAGLLAFKSGIKSDPSGMLLSWIPGTDCCSTWLGVYCSPPNRVTTLSIFGETDNSTQILSGTISPALSKLQYLDSIFLIDLRNLSGPFPSFLFNLPRLTDVNIVNNKLSGILPKNIGKLSSKLRTFTVEGNRFSGTIPTSLGQLTQLFDLNLGGNMFTGNIPYTIGNLTNLLTLRLDRNQLTGTIPDFFKGLTQLVYFNVSHNKLSGNIPESITATATILQYLEVAHNALTGKIPEFLGILNRLNTLDLSWNQFHGTVPKSFANLTGILNLDLSHNSLVSPFPELKMVFLDSLDLSYNQFHLEQIPAWLTSANARFVKLAKCGIKINLDNWNPAVPFYYTYIDLSENEITGSPVQILNRDVYLVGFYASGNKLKFSLESLKFTPTLTDLDLSRNLVYGKVPKEVSGLNKLNVSNNHLCGQLPKTKFPASAFLGNDCLCGSPLPQCNA